MIIEKTLDKLGPVLFVHCFAIPILDRAVIVNENFRRASKEESKILDDDIFVVKVRTSLFLFMLATCSEHASGKGVVGTTDNFA